jgi:hypothetical protein
MPVVPAANCYFWIPATTDTVLLMALGNRLVRYTPELDPSNLDTSAHLYAVRTVT